MVSKIPTLTPKGFVEAIQDKADAIMLNFYVSQYSQTNMFRGANKPLSYLVQQHGDNAVAIRDASGTKARVIGSILDVLDANAQRAELIVALADPRIRIVSLTVTEKGYCHDPSTGNLDPSHPDIVADLASPHAPVSAPGLIVRALELRRDAGNAPFTVMSCDNLPSNGKTVGRIVAQFARLRDPGLADWIEKSVAFPSTMVDRIVPATTDADRAIVEELTGVEDAWPIMTEPFTQWVIEDRFAAGRPRWESHGVQFVDDVSDWEAMKLRLLNAAHSCLAYLGVPAGLETVDRAIAEPALRAFVEAIWAREIAPTLPGRVRSQISGYCEALLARFANPALGHRTRQIAIDGSQKLPLRLLPSLRARLAAGQPFECLALAIAAWIRFLEGRTESGEAYEIDDPLARSLSRAAADAGPGSKAVVSALLRIESVFGSDLRDDPRAVDSIATQLDRLRASGSVAAARELVAALGHARGGLVGGRGARDTIAR